MAKMKHMKQPEPKALKPKKQRSPAPASQGEPRPSRTPMGRDRAFKEALAREYGVQEVPRSLQLRTMKTLESLPDTLPARPRPVLWALKSAASAAAVLAVSVVALLGLNTTHPQLTEALPGLGSVFVAMNGDRTPDSTPSPAPTPTPRPAFQPVTILNKGDFPGVLTVDDAWSDGNTLLVEMSISTYEDLYDNLDFYEDDPPDYIYLSPSVVAFDEAAGDNYEDHNGTLVVSSGSDEKSFTGALDSFQLDEESGKFTCRWRLDVDILLDVGDTLELDLFIPDLTAHYGYDNDEGSYTFSPGFDSKFTVPVSRGKNHSFAAQASDGPFTLKNVDYSPSRVGLDLSIPYLGMVSDMFPDRRSSDDIPLGAYATLTCMDGKYEYDLMLMDFDGKSMYTLSLDDTSPQEVHYTFTSPSLPDIPHPKELKGPLTLTFYEFPQDMGYSGRVLAQFSIDLSTGRAWSCEDYLEWGFEKGDATKTTIQRLEEASYDGILMLMDGNSPEGLDGSSGEMYEFAFSSSEANMDREVSVNCYIKDELIYAFDMELGGNLAMDEGGSFSTGYFDLPSTGQFYFTTYVTMICPEWLLEKYGYHYPVFDRLELMDRNSGEVIIPDLMAAWQETLHQLAGNGPEAYEARDKDLAAAG